MKKQNLQEKLIRDYVHYILLYEGPVIYKTPKSEQEETALLKLFNWALDRAKSRPGFFGPADLAEAEAARVLAEKGDWTALLEILQVILSAMKVPGRVSYA